MCESSELRRERVCRKRARHGGRAHHRDRAFVSVVAAAVTAGMALLAPPPLAAQEDPEALALECSGGVELTELHRWCLETALAAQAVRGEIAVMAAGGSDVPGTASTVGRRLGTTPRISLGFRITGTDAHVPDARRFASGSAPDASFVAPSLRAQVAMGVFEGFSPAPTVGGLLALDLVAGGSVVFLPGDRGFDGNLGGYLLGARIGVLRESFTLPGVSVGVARRGLGSVRLGTEGDDGEVDADLAVTSVRATVGKDLLAVGLLAGAGWDRISGDVRIRARAEEAGLAAVEGIATSDDLDTSRLSYFGGATLTFLILQVSAEVGWTEGFEAVPERAAGGYDPTDGSLFGSVSLRVTF